VIPNNNSNNSGSINYNNGSIMNHPAPSKDYDLDLPVVITSPQPTSNHSNNNNKSSSSPSSSPIKGSGSDHLRATPLLNNGRVQTAKPDSNLLMTNISLVGSGALKHHHHSSPTATTRSSSPSKLLLVEESKGKTTTTALPITTTLDLMEQAVHSVSPPPLEYRFSLGVNSTDTNNTMSSTHHHHHDSPEPSSQQQQQPLTPLQPSEYYFGLGRRRNSTGGMESPHPPPSQQQQQQQHVDKITKGAEYYLGLASPKVSPHVPSNTRSSDHHQQQQQYRSSSKVPHHVQTNISKSYHQPSSTTTTYMGQLKSPPSSSSGDQPQQQQQHRRITPFEPPQPLQPLPPSPIKLLAETTTTHHHHQQQQQDDLLSYSITISPSSHTTDFCSFFGDTHASGIRGDGGEDLPDASGPVPVPEQQRPFLTKATSTTSTITNPMSSSSTNPMNTTTANPSHGNAMTTTTTSTTTSGATLTSSTTKLSDLGRRLAQLSVASLGSSVTSKRLPTVLETNNNGHGTTQRFADEESSVGSRSAYPHGGFRGDASTAGGSSSLGYPTVGGGDSSFGGSSSGGYLLDGGSSMGGSSAYNSQDLGMYDSLHKVYRDMLARSMERQKMLEKQLQDDDSTYDGKTFADGGASTVAGNDASVVDGNSSGGSGGDSASVGESGENTSALLGKGDASAMFGGGGSGSDGEEQSTQKGDPESSAVVTDVAMEMFRQLTASQQELLLAKAVAASVAAEGNHLHQNQHHNSTTGRSGSPTTTLINNVGMEIAGSSNDMNGGLSTRTKFTDSTLEVSSVDDDSLQLKLPGTPPSGDNKRNGNITGGPDDEAHHRVEATEHSRSLATDESVFSASVSTMSVRWADEDAPPSVSSEKAMQEAFAVLSPNDPGINARRVFSTAARAAASDFSGMDSGHCGSIGEVMEMNNRIVFSSHGAMAPGSKLVSDSDFSDLESGHLRGDSSGAVSSRAVASSAECFALGNESTLLTNSTQQSAGERSLTINKANALLAQVAIQSIIKKEEQRKQATIILSSSLKEKPRFSLPIRPRPKSPLASPTSTGKQGILKTWNNPPVLPEETIAESPDVPAVVSERDEEHAESYPEPTSPLSKRFGLSSPLDLVKPCSTKNMITHWRWVVCLFTFVLVVVVVGSVVGVGSKRSQAGPIDALQPAASATVSPAASLPFALGGPPVSTVAPSSSPPTSPSNFWNPSSTTKAPSSTSPTLQNTLRGPVAFTSQPVTSTSQPAPQSILSTSQPTAAPFVLPNHLQPPNGSFPLATPSSFTQVPTRSPSTQTNSTLTNLMDLLVAKSLDGGKTLQNLTSAQYQSYLWLANNSNLETYSEQVLVQRYVLATFFYSTMGGQWTFKNGWLSDETECNWFSTTSNSMFPVCDANGTFVDLDLKYNNLDGTLPSELALLSNGLSRMNLSYNSLKGSIPTELGLLTGINTITMGSNNFTGSIPTEIGSWSQIESLDFGFNLLSGNVPSEIGLLRQLNVLDLQQNGLIGNVPTEIGNLPTCTRLSLSQNRLAGTLPTQIGSLINLRELDLGFNGFSNLPTEIGNLTNLEIFSIQNNRVGGMIPSEIGMVTRLRKCFGSVYYLCPCSRRTAPSS
jgi:Leucine-rich repeat (LRR) protein